jgi:putative lipase involved disintegration of autophagic bodies
MIQLFLTFRGAVFSSPTGDRDHENDNMMFSCCARDQHWNSKCEVTSLFGRSIFSHKKQLCDFSCMQDEIKDDSHSLYLQLASEILKTTQTLYPNHSIWLTGHSLGGALASLVALSSAKESPFKPLIPAITFEAPVLSFILTSRQLV